MKIKPIAAVPCTQKNSHTRYQKMLHRSDGAAAVCVRQGGAQH
ncbi:unnamed protein product [Ectocarpus sp. CCAP 1310/34]|nr:unnamed protein product [Ectocarpus sp. CCAP 1310/34]